MFNTSQKGTKVEIEVKSTVGPITAGFLDLKEETLYLTPDEKSGSLGYEIVDEEKKYNLYVGIDMSVLNSLSLNYHYIRFLYNNRSYGSTRSYVKAHSQEKIVKGMGRAIAIMPLKQWDMVKAIIWDSQQNEKDQLDLFQSDKSKTEKIREKSWEKK